MAQPTNDILIIATDTLGGDGYTNKEAPDAPVLNLGYGKQSSPYQQYNYSVHNHGEWLKYINEEQIPTETQSREDADVTLQENIDAEALTRGEDDDTEALTRATDDGILQDNIDDEALTRATDDGILQDNIDDLSLNHGLGYNQTWQDVTGSRGSGITYTNTTGKPIQVLVFMAFSASTSATVTIDAIVTTSAVGSGGTETGVNDEVSMVIPNNSTYSIANYTLMHKWLELR